MHISRDSEANAGYIRFAQTSPYAGEVTRSLPVDDDGEVVAVLDLNGRGEIVGLELLNASQQMAHLDESGEDGGRSGGGRASPLSSRE